MDPKGAHAHSISSKHLSALDIAYCLRFLLIGLTTSKTMSVENRFCLGLETCKPR